MRLIAQTNLFITNYKILTVYAASVCHVMDTLIGPLMKSLTNRLEQNKESKQRLLKEKHSLQEQIDAIERANNQLDT